MSSCEELTRSSDTALSCTISSELQEAISNSTLALFAASDLPPSSHTDVSSAATTALHLERYASELLLWLQRSDVTSLADEALYFFETRHPELLDDLPLLFTWLSLFLSQHEAVSSVKNEQQLDSARHVATNSEEFGLKSALTLLYWKHEEERQQRTDIVETSGSSKSRRVFQDEKGLLEWVLEHRQVPLTRQDVINHVVQEYPVFAASKSNAALKVWTSRFLKKHLPSHPSTTESPVILNGKHVATESEVMRQQIEVSNEVIVESTSPSKAAFEPQEKVLERETRNETTVGKSTGKRRSCSGRYMLFSNEFKLQAIEMLEAGKSVAEVAEELGLKNANCLSYWKSIRDKLVISERKRFRLAGGGRRSSCTFEDELLTWVNERHDRGQSTDVKAVLDYMKQYHSSFTEGKKESSLRKWILRFFKRCWGAPGPSMESQDGDKAHISV